MKWKATFKVLCFAFDVYLSAFGWSRKRYKECESVWSPRRQTESLSTVFQHHGERYRQRVDESAVWTEVEEEMVWGLIKNKTSIQECLAKMVVGINFYSAM